MSLNRRRKAKERANTIRVLRDLNSWSTHRIKNGDLDFDNIVYRTRDASEVLLSIWDEKEEA